MCCLGFWIQLMGNNSASSADACPFVYTVDEAYRHGGVRVYWVLGCLLEQVCVCVEPGLQRALNER